MNAQRISSLASLAALVAAVSSAGGKVSVVGPDGKVHDLTGDDTPKPECPGCPACGVNLEEHPECKDTFNGEEDHEFGLVDADNPDALRACRPSHETAELEAAYSEDPDGRRFYDKLVSTHDVGYTRCSNCGQVRRFRHIKRFSLADCLAKRPCLNCMEFGTYKVVTVPEAPAA